MERNGHKLPPQDIEAEQATLAGAIMDNEKISVIREVLVTDDFYRGAHQQIFCAIVDLDEKSIAVDLVTVANELRKREQLDSVGGAAYLASILDATPTAENIESHARIVKQKSILRRIIETCSELIVRAYEGKEEIEDIVGALYIASQELIEKLATGKRIKRIKMTGFENLTGLRRTPLKSLNNAIGGFFQQFFFIGGKEGVGKTSFAIGQILYTAITEKLPAVYCGTAIPEEIFQLMILSNLSGISFDILQKGNVSAEDRTKLLAAEKAIDEAEIHYLIEPEKLDIIRLSADLKKLKKDVGKLGIVMIENFQEIELRGKFKNDREKWEAIATILSGLPKELEAPVGISCQLVKDVDKREKENRRPILSDLRDWGTIGAKATKGVLLYRSGYYDVETSTTGSKKQTEPEVGEIFIAKGGPPMSIRIIYDGGKYRWRDID